MGVPSQKVRSRPLSRKRLWQFRLLACGLAVTLICGMSEIGLRVMGYDPAFLNPLEVFHVPDPVTAYRGTPGFSGIFQRPEFRVLIEHDEQGFRKHVTPPPAKPRNHVYAFGDSFTWGWGVGPGEVYTDILARELPDQQVHNLGLNASGTVQQFRLYEQLVAPQIQPGDVVLVACFQNDFRDNTTGFIPTSLVGSQLVHDDVKMVGQSWITSIKRHSYLVNLANYTLATRKLNQKQKRQQAASEQQLALGLDSPECRVLAAVLQKFRLAVEGRGAHFRAVYVAHQYDLNELAPSAKETATRPPYREMFLEAARVGGVTAIDLTPAFLAEKAAIPDLRISWPQDGHWTAAGQRIAGEMLAEILRKTVFVDAVAPPAPVDGTPEQSPQIAQPPTEKAFR